MFYYTRNIGDYLTATGHLTLLEHGVLTLLLDWQHRQELPLPENKEAIYRLCRATKPSERKAVDVVVAEFFPDGINPTVRKEIDGYHKQKKNKQHAANVRWLCRKDAGALQEGCTPDANRKPETVNREPSTVAAEAAAAASVEIPSVEEVKTWAEMSGIPPEYAENLHRKTTDDHMWVRAGKLANWRKRWQDFWVQDRESWGKNGARGAEKMGRDEVPPAPGFGLTIEKMKTAV